MGEVIGGSLIFVLFVVTVFALISILRNYDKARKPETETTDYRNHLAMARWIEHTLDDDMERVVVPETRQKQAEKLLEEFYKEKRQ